jgi:hypothetical protein
MKQDRSALSAFLFRTRSTQRVGAYFIDKTP